MGLLSRAVTSDLPLGNSRPRASSILAILRAVGRSRFCRLRSWRRFRGRGARNTTAATKGFLSPPTAFSSLTTPHSTQAAHPDASQFEKFPLFHIPEISVMVEGESP